MLSIYILVFSKIMRARLPGVDDTFGYGIYLCAGIIFWSMFSEVIGSSQNMFVANANLLKKLSFPRLCLPIIVVLNAWLNLLMVIALFVSFLTITGFWPGWPLLALLPLVILQTAMAISLGLAFGVVNVFFRDVSYFTGMLLQLWFWATPIVYPLSILPEFARELFSLNPMFPLIQGYQNIFLFGQWPNWESLLGPLIFTVVTSALAARMYYSHASEMVDEL